MSHETILSSWSTAEIKSELHFMVFIFITHWATKLSEIVTLIIE